MILTAKALLNENPDPSEIEVREAISGNLCRCTGYAKIVDAIVAGAEHNKDQLVKSEDRALEKGPLLTPETGE